MFYLYCISVDYILLFFVEATVAIFRHNSDGFHLLVATHCPSLPESWHS